MDIQLLIDSIVRQTTVLIAQLATAGGVRAPLAHVANQVFLDLAEELNHQGVSRKVGADMFGLALRTYLRKIQRLSESSTDRGRSLWEAVLSHLGEGQVLTRGEILHRFRNDDADLIRGVLHDLCDSGLVFRLGSGHHAAYRAATSEELGNLRAQTDSDGEDELIWVLVYRDGPLSRSEILRRTRGGAVEPALSRLLAAGRVVVESGGDDPVYAAREFFVPLGASAGWEAAVFDHFQAMVKTIAARLQRDAPTSEKDAVGGSTYTFHVWPGHPHESEVLQQLQDFRARTGALREKVRAYNRTHPHPDEYRVVTVYGGQGMTVQSEDGGENHV